jgi:hypothetical protein
LFDVYSKLIQILKKSSLAESRALGPENERREMRERRCVERYATPCAMWSQKKDRTKMRGLRQSMLSGITTDSTLSTFFSPFLYPFSIVKGLYLGQVSSQVSAVGLSLT